MPGEDLSHISDEELLLQFKAGDRKAYEQIYNRYWAIMYVYARKIMADADDLYDSAYTERFMDSPKENPEGYKSSSVFTYVKNLKGHLSLAQGTMDDNVHMRNTMKLVDALMEADKDFNLMFYPGAAHGWYYLPHKAKFQRKADDEFIKKYLLPIAPLSTK